MRLPLMRCLVEWCEQDVPALAVAARAAGERDAEHKIQRRNLPFMAREVAVDFEVVWLEEVRRRAVIAMLLLYAGEDREFALWSHVHFELRHTVHFVIVDPLAVRAVGFAARLPVALEDVLGILRVRGELRRR